MFPLFSTLTYETLEHPLSKEGNNSVPQFLAAATFKAALCCTNCYLCG